MFPAVPANSFLALFMSCNLVLYDPYIRVILMHSYQQPFIFSVHPSTSTCLWFPSLISRWCSFLTPFLSHSIALIFVQQSYTVNLHDKPLFPEHGLPLDLDLFNFFHNLDCGHIKVSVILQRLIPFLLKFKHSILSHVLA